MSASLSVYKAQPYSVSALPTLKVALRILRCVRTHTPSTFKAVPAMVYFSCSFICLGQSLCTKGGANSHYKLNYNDQVLHKPPSKWKEFGGVLQHAGWLNRGSIWINVGQCSKKYHELFLDIFIFQFVSFSFLVQSLSSKESELVFMEFSILKYWNNLSWVNFY